MVKVFFSRKNALCNLYTALWCLYYLQGTLYEQGGIISKFILVVTLAMTLYLYVDVCFKYRLPSVLKAINVMLIVATVYGLIRIIEGDLKIGYMTLDKFAFLKVFYLSFMPVFAYFSFTKKGVVNQKWFNYWIWPFVIFAILTFYKEQSNLLEAALNGRTEFTMNSGYVFLSVIPLVAFQKNNLLKSATLVVCMLFMLLAMKRGAILLGATCTIFMFWNLLKVTKRTTRIWVVTIIGISLSVIIGYVLHLAETSDYFMFRYEQTMEGNSGGRDELYSTFFNYLTSQQSPINIIFGVGGQGVMRLFGQQAHNDWFEFAIDMGMVGLFVYILFWSRFYKTWRKIPRDSLVYISMGMLFIITFGKTFFSMSYSDWSVAAVSLFGYSIAVADDIVIKKILLT